MHLISLIAITACAQTTGTVTALRIDAVETSLERDAGLLHLTVRNTGEHDSPDVVAYV